MSAARSSARDPRPRPDAAQTRNMAELRERRRRARARTRLVRLDLGLGVLAAIVLLIISPGLAITGLVALALLAGVFGSIAIERRRRGRRRARGSARRERPGTRQ